MVNWKPAYLLLKLDSCQNAIFHDDYCGAVPTKLAFCVLVFSAGLGQAHAFAHKYLYTVHHILEVSK